MLFLILSMIFLSGFEITSGAQFQCPSDTQEVKLKYGELQHFVYNEKCPGRLPAQNALLGSQSVMDCGEDGENATSILRQPQGFTAITILDWDFASTQYVKKLCLNVHGAANVTVHMIGFTSITAHVEDLSQYPSWHRFCVEPGLDTDVYIWDIDLFPKLDGSRVMVKNAKLTACNFEYQY